MSLLHKVRTLVGALVHKPFAPRTEKNDLEEDSHGPEGRAVQRDSAALEAQEPEIADTARVADLIAQRQREGKN